MEAICILLCDKYPTSRKEAKEAGRRASYTSRWKLITSEYHFIRQRLLNSEALLEGTNLVLFNINEITLVSLVM